MAIQAPLHVERVGFPGQRHLGYLSVASGAADTFTDVDAVIEVDEIRQRIHARPGNGLVVAIAGAHRLEHWRVRPDLRMARHAGLSGRQTREGRFFHRGVAGVWWMLREARAVGLRGWAEAKGRAGGGERWGGMVPSTCQAEGREGA